MVNDQPFSITLRQSRIVVAGGTSGIGFGVAEAAAQAGAEVIIASSNPERVAAALDRLPRGTRGETLDFTDEAQVSALFARVELSKCATGAHSSRPASCARPCGTI
jgi:NAD(P)-dependent dehydrogenase (short-subunit alcohol dehydrogenase family)